jgi:fumarylacetoacetase
MSMAAILPGARIAGVRCIGFGVAAADDGAAPFVAARVEASVVDLSRAAAGGVVADAPWWHTGSLDALLAAGPAAWGAAVTAVEALPDDVVGIVGVVGARPLLPFTVGDYVDFYASEQHATNIGRLLRPGQPALPPNWHHLPIGYHGRSGTVVVSGSPVRRPRGQVLAAGATTPVFGPTARLDVEVELGFVVGVPSTMGEPLPVDAFADHVFGVCLVNDWSARDIQAWEYQPLGPFLGKSFATSVSPWVVPLSVLAAARLPVPSASYGVLPYLRETQPWGLDVSFELRVNGEVVSRPPYRSMFWSPAQMLAHLTGNGASVRTGDLFASGTVSGAADDEVGSLFELWRGERFLADGDEVVISASAPAVDGGRLDLGTVAGVVSPVVEERL